jgi:hypothetical protein
MKHALRVLTTAVALLLLASSPQAQTRLSLADLQAQLNAQSVTLQALQGQNAALQTSVTTLNSTVAGLQAFKDSVACITGRPGVGAVPDVVFTGCNVQVVNGLGSQMQKNAVGNLIVGYNDLVTSAGGPDPDRSGSHNLVVGPFHEYTSVGGFVAGGLNSLHGISTSIVGGISNIANAHNSTIVGGNYNVTGDVTDADVGIYSTILGGGGNTTKGGGSTIAGGAANVTFGTMSSIAGGRFNTTNNHTYYSAISGGRSNTTNAADQVVP